MRSLKSRKRIQRVVETSRLRVALIQNFWQRSSAIQRWQRCWPTWRTVCINKRCQTTGVTYIESIVVSGLNRTRAQYSLYCHLSQQAHFGDLFRLKSMLSVRLGMGSKGRNRNVSVLAADLKIVIEHLPRQPHFGDLIRLRCVTPSSALKWVFAPIESNRSGKWKMFIFPILAKSKKQLKSPRELLTT